MKQLGKTKQALVEAVHVGELDPLTTKPVEPCGWGPAGPGARAPEWSGAEARVSPAH